MIYYFELRGPSIPEALLYCPGLNVQQFPMTYIIVFQ